MKGLGIPTQGRECGHEGRYQGRVSHKPTSTVQRSVGLFSTKEEAAEAVLAAERMLDAGVTPYSVTPSPTHPHLHVPAQQCGCQ